jgi:tetratricopeptide (TPR) repeat protein
MLVGEPGIGKTRLSEEFAVYARLRGAQVLTGVSYEGAVEVSYFPFVEAFRQYVRARPDDELRRELGQGAPEVANLISEIRQRMPDLPQSPPLQGDAERLRLFESVSIFLRNAAETTPVVLHLDDLHWADEPSLLLLRYLARNLASERVLILGTYRDVDLDRTHPLSKVLGTLRSESSFRRILLRGLPSSDVFAYLSALADDTPDAAATAGRQAFAETLHRETEGNPFFLSEVLSHLVESGKLFWDGARWTANVASPSELGIPEGVREVVGRRLSAVSDTCNQLLTVGSAMPAGFAWSVVLAAVDVEEAALLDALDEALAARLIREREGGADNTYEFTHALIRQTLYEELSGPRRVLLHRRIGERLEATVGKNPGAYLPELAHHFFQAAPGGDVAKAVDYLVQAGERAVSSAALEEAVGHFDRALQALDLDQSDAVRRCAVLLELAKAHGRLGHLDRAKESAEPAAALARSLGSPEQLALAALHYGSEHAPTFQLDIARVSLLEEALEACPEDGLAVRLLRRLTMEFAFTDVPRSEAYADRAVELARRLGEPAALASALSAKHLAVGDRLDERLEISRELSQVAREAGLESYRAESHANRHFDLLERGDTAGARAELEAYAALANETREPTALWLSAVYQGLWLILEGRFEEAEALADETLERAQRFDVGGASFHAIQISRVRAEQGRLEEMIPVIEQVLRDMPLIGWRCRLLQLFAECGRTEDARRELDLLAADGFEAIPRDNTWLLSICYVAEACAILGDTKRAEVLYQLLLPHAHATSKLPSTWIADWAHARCWRGHRSNTRRCGSSAMLRATASRHSSSPTKRSRSHKNWA